jgi:DNA polymerase
MDPIFQKKPMTDPLATLHWLVQAGADEAIGEVPLDRLARPERAPAQAAKPSVPRQGDRKRDVVPLQTSDAVGAAMDLARAAASLKDLRAAMEGFEGCALKRTASNTVFADGVPGHVMFIGEAPGRDEDRIGKPFVGRAGQLLDKMMASIGLARDSNAYITNVINWRPPGNRDPSPEEAAQCLPFLRRHIELARPRLIILLGAVATRHVAGATDGIMKLRGRWLDYRVDGRVVPLMPTLHPAYLLRQPAHKKLAWRDLQAARARLRSLAGATADAASGGGVAGTSSSR